MNLHQQYEKIAKELQDAEYELHSLKTQLKRQIQGVEEVVATAKRVGVLGERLLNIETSINNGYR